MDHAGAPGILDYQRFLADDSEALTPVVTAAEPPTLLIYTSRITGPPKGALYARRVLLGHLPASECYHASFPHPDDRFWSPAYAVTHAAKHAQIRLEQGKDIFPRFSWSTERFRG